MCAVVLSILMAFSLGGCDSCEHSYVYGSYVDTHFLKCEKCGRMQEGSKEAHVPVELAAKAPGYIEEGNEVGQFCDICKRILEGCKLLPSQTLFVGKSYQGLQYCEYKPNAPTGEKRPLVLFMHGAGERGDNNKSQLKHAITKVINPESDSPFMDAVVLAPQCPADEYWTNVDHKQGAYLVSETAETEILKKVVALVQEYVKESYVDGNRVYVLGMSMGGYASFDLIARYPDLFAAAVPICGGGALDKVDVLKELPIYVFHGKKDPIVQYKGSEDTVNAILAAGGRSVLFKTYENGYHDIWNKAITFEGDERLPALAEWLFKQTKAVKGQGI